MAETRQGDLLQGTESGPGLSAQQCAEVERQLDVIKNFSRGLSPRERAFVGDVAERYERFGPKLRLTEKQRLWLAAIASAAERYA